MLSLFCIVGLLHEFELITKFNGLEERLLIFNLKMKSATAFPQSKIKEIALTDPDVKDISKPAIEVLKNAAEIFAAQFFQKCFEEAHRGRRITSKINDFISVVNKDEVLNQMLSQFIVNQRDIEKDENDASDDIENVADDIDASKHSSENNSGYEIENEEIIEEIQNNEENNDDENNENSDDQYDFNDEDIKPSKSDSSSSSDSDLNIEDDDDENKYLDVDDD